MMRDLPKKRTLFTRSAKAGSQAHLDLVWLCRWSRVNLTPERPQGPPRIISGCLTLVLASILSSFHLGWELPWIRLPMSTACRPTPATSHRWWCRSRRTCPHGRSAPRLCRGSARSLRAKHLLRMPDSNGAQGPLAAPDAPSHRDTVFRNEKLDEQKTWSTYHGQFPRCHGGTHGALFPPSGVGGDALHLPEVRLPTSPAADTGRRESALSAFSRLPFVSVELGRARCLGGPQLLVGQVKLPNHHMVVAT